MIAPLNEQNRAEYLRRCAAVPALGPLLAANAAAFGLGGQLVQCYLCDAGVLQLRGASATLLGSTDGEELADVLTFLGITALRTQETVPPPPGWQCAGRTCVLEWQPVPGAALPPLPQEIALNEEPSVGAVLEILAGEGIADLAAENLYSELCAKRSRGLACVWTAEADGAPIGCACASAITDREAYLSEIATLPAARGKGIGRALVAALAARLAEEGRRVTLLCAPHRRSFYESFGFVQCGSFCELKPLPCGE